MGCGATPGVSADAFNRLQQENADLRRQLSLKNKTLQWNDHNIWNPIQQIVTKFNEADIDKSGFIDRTEFHKLCDALHDKTMILPLYSMQDQHTKSTGASFGLIDTHNTWIPQTHDTNQWYQIDAVQLAWIRGVAIQGHHTEKNWVKTFKISHSVDGAQWTNVDTIYAANTDNTTQNRVLFDKPIHCRFIRVHPISWHGGIIAMRLDLLWIDQMLEVNTKTKMCFFLGSEANEHINFHKTSFFFFLYKNGFFL